MKKNMLIKCVIVTVALMCSMFVSCGKDDADKPAVTTDTTKTAESVVSGDITTPVHTENGDTSFGTVTENGENGNSGGMYVTGGNVDLGDPDDKGESPKGDRGDADPAVTVNTERSEEKPDVTDGKGNASSIGNDGTTTKVTTTKSTTKATTTTKPLIQVLPDGGILLPDDVWED